MIDKYFKRPVFWDYILASLLSSIAFYLICICVITLPKEEFIYSVTSDISTMALTMAGFILSLLTVLISFKSTIKKTYKPSDNDTVFDIFFSTALYFETIRHLKNAIISLTLVAIVGYIFKLCFASNNSSLLFIFNCFGIVVVFLTVWRCVLILSKIIKIQQED